MIEKGTKEKGRSIVKRKNRKKNKRKKKEKKKNFIDYLFAILSTSILPFPSPYVL